MDIALKIQGLSKQFGNVQAVTSLHLDIPRGSVFGILGPNGSGKSTTLGMVLGTVIPSAGNFQWLDSSGQAIHRSRIGSLLEQPNFYGYLSARRNLELVAAIKDTSKEKVDDLLSMVGLLQRADSKYKTFSTGMKQRLALASILLSDPDIVVLDEPTNGMDPQGIIDIRHLILRIASTGITVILASHLLDEVEKVCTHVAVLKNGILLETRELGASSRSEHNYLVASEGLKQQWLMMSGGNDLLVFWKSDNEAVVTTTWDGSRLNEFLFSRGIVVSKLVPVEPSLESQFLSITAS
jgi:ABC-2 type transport system ATP-binding protein